MPALLELTALRAVIVLFLFCANCSCLRQGDEGVCVKNITTHHRVGIGRGRMVNHKQIQKLMCCDDWKFEYASKKCVFYCRLGCERGKCIGPNICSCDPPYELVNGECVEPVCEPPCSNGRCTAKNTCLCYPEYEELNATHCAPKCEPGYMHPCRNGTCTPETDPFACVPVCESECENGECVEPGVCECNEGYKNETNRGCSPVCDSCENGNCVAPNECECFEGYSRHLSGVCTPVCEEPCTNGYCSAPNSCECFEGYSRNLSGVCTPVCEDPCTNGYCSAPNSCECFEGYSRNLSGVCTPVCEDPCTNGYCLAPNSCECFEGYSRNLSGVCTPVCKDPCTNGYCSAPNVCSCNIGYLMQNSAGECTPVCTEPCENGYCESPEQCACNPGYVRSNGSVPLCRKGCEGPCDHGICTVYGTCECDRGFQLRNGTCVQISTKSVNCENCSGTCTEGSCRCDDDRICFLPTVIESAEVASSSRLAGLELSWVVGGAVGLLLMTLVIAIFGHMWRRRKYYGAKTTNDKGNTFGSVVYTVPNTLLNKGDGRQGCDRDDYDLYPSRAAGGALLDETDVRDESTYK